MANFFKDPQARLDYGFNWAPWLGTDTITSSTWTADDGITIVSSSNDTTTTTVWVDGGVDGMKYAVTNHVETAAGREDDRTITLFVRQR